MALRDDLNQIIAEKQKKESNKYSDEYVYRVLIQCMYRDRIINPIKRAVSEGKAQISGEFTLSYATTINELFPESKLSDNSLIYTTQSGYDSPDEIHLKPLFTVKTGIIKSHVNMTALGERVYNDLKQLALKDRILLSAPYPHFSRGVAYGTGYSIGFMNVKFTYNL